MCTSRVGSGWGEKNTQSNQLRSDWVRPIFWNFGPQPKPTQLDENRVGWSWVHRLPHLSNKKKNHFTYRNYRTSTPAETFLKSDQFSSLLYNFLWTKKEKKKKSRDLSKRKSLILANKDLAPHQQRKMLQISANKQPKQKEHFINNPKLTFVA